MLNKSNTEQVLEIIFKNPTERFTIRGLARKAGIAPPTAMEIAHTLKKEGMVKETKVARASQISANFESKAYLWKKRVYNLESVFSSGLVDCLAKAYNDPRAIILFGSYSRGDDIERSDIDIAIITDLDKRHNLAKFENLLARKINIHEVKIDRVSDEFRNSLCNGIVLWGAL